MELVCYDDCVNLFPTYNKYNSEIDF